MRLKKMIAVISAVAMMASLCVFAPVANATSNNTVTPVVTENAGKTGVWVVFNYNVPDANATNKFSVLGWTWKIPKADLQYFDLSWFVTTQAANDQLADDTGEHFTQTLSDSFLVTYTTLTGDGNFTVTGAATTKAKRAATSGEAYRVFIPYATKHSTALSYSLSGVSFTEGATGTQYVADASPVVFPANATTATTASGSPYDMTKLGLYTNPDNTADQAVAWTVSVNADGSYDQVNYKVTDNSVSKTTGEQALTDTAGGGDVKYGLAVGWLGSGSTPVNPSATATFSKKG